VGFFTAAPTITFNLSDMQGYNRVIIKTRGNDNCDTVLMVRDSHGNWYHDDDSGSDLLSKIILRNMDQVTGRVDVWVGTYGSAQCNVTLQIATR
jgi:hypothetical protein